MRKIYLIIITVLLLPVFVYALTDNNYSVNVFSAFPDPFNEQFNPADDSPLNFLDDDKKTSGLFTDFSMEFNKPVSVDEIKIFNGISADKKLSVRYKRLRDVEITLYTVSEPDIIKKEKSDSKKKAGKKKSTDTKTDKKTNDQKPSEKEIKDNPEKKDKSDNVTAYLFPVIGSLNTVLAEEPVPDFLKQDEPASGKNDDENKIDILKTDSGVEKLVPPSKDILKKFDKKEVPQKKSDKKKTKSENIKSKSSSTKKSVKKETEENKTQSVKKNKEEKKKIISKTEIKDGKGKTTEKELPLEPLKKITGILKPEKDSQGRLLVYVSLKDTHEPQSIKLKKKYNVRRIELRSRDEAFYKENNYETVKISEISLYNKGKKIIFDNISVLKKAYIEKYSRLLENSISDEIFSSWTDGKEILRMSFRKDGRIEFKDRYTCRKNGDPDCTSTVMPHRWKIQDGRLLMMYGRDWLTWKFQLDSAGNILDNNSSFNPPRWFKLYYRNGTSFSDNYLYLQRSEEREWRWDN